VYDERVITGHVPVIQKSTRLDCPDKPGNDNMKGWKPHWKLELIEKTTPQCQYLSNDITK